MKNEIADIDDVMGRISKISNRLHRVLLSNINNQEKTRWGVENREGLNKIAKDSKFILIDEIKDYFLNNPYISLKLKEEVLKQNIMNFFSSDDFINKVQNVSSWQKKYEEELVSVTDKYEKEKERENVEIKKYKRTKFFMPDFGMENINIRYMRALSNIEIDITKSEYYSFVNNIIKNICLESLHECLVLTDNDLNKLNNNNVGEITLKKIKDKKIKNEIMTPKRIIM